MMLARANQLCHRWIAGSRSLARIYFSVIPHISRRASETVRQRLRNGINSATWPSISLRPYPVIVGQHTEITLHPHFEEFDLDAALTTRLPYEQEVFTFLESRLDAYGSVIEIGANVGVFTVFFAQCFKRLGYDRTVYAFEPSRRAYQRLLENVTANSVDNVVCFNCAVGAVSGFAELFEPEGHLTNGSLDAEFAQMFGAAVKASPTIVITGNMIDDLVKAKGATLLKIDVEGAEVEVLRSLEQFIVSRQPDIILEVLPMYEDHLNSLSFFHKAGYSLFHITPEGLDRQTKFIGGVYRDYFLTVRPHIGVEENGSHRLAMAGRL
jgi:FkbM family methyltransferase